LALRKLGAVPEGVLRQSFCRHGQVMDQTLWSLIASDWRCAKASWRPLVSS
jgi:RimJ/RimL family protein N-acetyltransferase